MANTDKNWTHCTLKAVELAEISLQTAQDQLQQAQEALADAQREHNVASAILDENQDSPPSDEDAVEELVGEGFDYDVAEAILRSVRYDYLTQYDVDQMSQRELKAIMDEGKLSSRALALAARRHESVAHTLSWWGDRL